MSSAKVTILRVDAVEEHAFDAHYTDDEGVYDQFPYGIIALSDRNGDKYWWATQSDTKSLAMLKVGQFIATTYQERDELPGHEHEWHEDEPDGLSIYDLHWRYAPWSARWGVTKPQSKSRMTGNLAPKNRDAR